MLGRQTKQLEAFQRVVQFVTNSPPPGANGKFAELSRELEKVVARAFDDATHQEFSERWCRATTQQTRALMKRLRDHHLRPLATIARAVMHDEPGIEKAIRLPRRRLGVTVLAAEARGMRDNAAKRAQLFIDFGRAPDFLSRLDDAIAAMEASQREGMHALGNQVGATAGIGADLRRARDLVMVLECQILIGFEGDAAKLAEWRSAKRVQSKPGGRRQESEATPVVVQEQVVESQQLQLVAA